MFFRFVGCFLCVWCGVLFLLVVVANNINMLDKAPRGSQQVVIVIVVIVVIVVLVIVIIAIRVVIVIVVVIVITTWLEAFHVLHVGYSRT